MSLAEIVSYGLKPVASVSILEDQFRVEVSDGVLAQETQCIYAFVVDDRILRVGSSKAKLSKRLNAWARDVSAALQGHKYATPKSEAEGWRSELERAGRGKVFARRGTIVKTPLGEISSYLDEERVLIEKYRPRFNHSHR